MKKPRVAVGVEAEAGAVVKPMAAPASAAVTATVFIVLRSMVCS